MIFKFTKKKIEISKNVLKTEIIRKENWGKNVFISKNVKKFAVILKKIKRSLNARMCGH